ATIYKNESLYAELKASNQKLAEAYEATLAGWSHALELRDKETEGHTERVTELTLRIARDMGFTEDELLHIRRGALLHDIGKLGVPDEILYKPGPLTEQEWQAMRQHPQFAYDLISPIEYLHPALEIPYCHHEKWDGSGYPRGLRGKEIPLAARIFAVIDVFDALTSTRPYREAWTRERALEHIRQESGTHFDPRIVAFFIKEVARI
ncbi:MAG: HD domain-containing phosphohydrolase, partial [Chloroflexota bacterium]